MTRKNKEGYPDGWKCDPYLLGWTYGVTHGCGFYTRNQGQWLDHIKSCKIKLKWHQKLRFWRFSDD